MNRIKPLRVLQIVDNLSIMSGVSSMIMNLYKNIDKNKVQFDFLVTEKRKDSYEEEIKRMGGKVFYTGKPLAKSFFQANKRMKIFFKKYSNKYIIAHLHSPTISEFTIRYAKRYGIQHIIVHSHSTMTSKNRVKASVNCLLTLRIKRLANHYWACSNEAARFLYGSNYKSLKGFELIYNAVDIELYRFNPKIRKRIRSELKIDDFIAVAHISNFSPIKNHSFLIDVIQRTPSKYKYIFVGDGPEKEKFEDALKENNCYEKCMFLGRREDVNIILQGVDLVILPSIKEGLPVTIVEAQAAGLPCLISDSITKDVKVNKVDYLSLNAQKWSDKIMSFIGLSDEKRNEASNQFSLSQFNIENESKRVERLYLDMGG